MTMPTADEIFGADPPDPTDPNGRDKPLARVLQMSGRGARPCRHDRRRRFWKTSAFMHCAIASRAGC